jgi:hypothetical protein
LRSNCILSYADALWAGCWVFRGLRSLHRTGKYFHHHHHHHHHYRITTPQSPHSLPPGEFITISPDIAASSSSPELLRACLIFIDDYGGKIMSDCLKTTLAPLRTFARGSNRYDMHRV